MKTHIPHFHRQPVRKQGPYERLAVRITQLSYSTLFRIWIAMALGFAFIYFLLTFIPGHGPGMRDGMPMVHTFWNSLYFSIITATSTGYGDIVPHGISKALSAMQSISALIIFAVFVTKLVSHKQEVALEEVHRMTFEDVFHNTREGLYICRRDFDLIMRHAEKHHELDEDDWDTMVIAYRQIQTLLQQVPDFYASDVHTYTIDAKREKLLIEAVHRTLHRVNTMLDALSTAGIDWVSHEESIRELRETIRMVDEITPLWRERTPHSGKEAFEDIVHMKESVIAMIKRSLPLQS